MSTMFEHIGEQRLKIIMSEFVTLMTQDMMIGFFFNNISTPRLIELEYEHMAQFLGAPLVYSGRKLPTAHKKHAIMGAQFDRRKMILLEVLTKHQISEHIVQAIMQHTESLRAQITQYAPGECE